MINLDKFLTGVCVILFLVTIILLVVKAHAAEPVEEPREMVASWYSRASLTREGTWKNGERRMANGERFAESRLTCATRLYPLGTILQVMCPRTGRSVVVEVTDRIGKRFARTRIDLTPAAYRQIADLSTGVTKVRVEVMR